MKAAANRDDAYFRSFHKNMRDFDSLEKSEVLTSRAGPMDDGDDTRLHARGRLRRGHGRGQGLEYSERGRRRGAARGRPPKGKPQGGPAGGGTRLDAFEKWFDSAVSHTCEFGRLGVVGNNMGRALGDKSPGSKGEQAGICKGFVLAEGGGIASEQPAGDCSRAATSSARHRRPAAR